MSESSIERTLFPLILIAVFFTIALPMFCTIVLFAPVDVSAILNERNVDPGVIMSLGSRLGKLSVSV